MSRIADGRASRAGTPTRLPRTIATTGRAAVVVRVGLLAAALTGSLALAGCTPDEAAIPPASSPPAGADGPLSSPSPSDAPVTPTLHPAGSATDNLPFFDHVNHQLLQDNPAAGGRDFVDALTAAGFARGELEVTRDQTTVGLDADSVQFAVRVGEECLIGQSGPGSGDYYSMVAPLLGTGSCLVGDTRPIDW